ncbi:MAG: XRE family transcriptional regulator [Sphingobacteriaceae bacterium]|nr:XRE family transcriptional regulator [Sphingobacteriaceae bacterium]
MTKNQRLKISRVKAGLSQAELAEKLDSKQPYIAKLEKSDDFSEAQGKKLAIILGVDPEWLMNGDEKDIRKEERNITKGVPYYDSDITGSIVGSFSDIKERPAFFIDFKPFNDCDAYFTIHGDSMFPKYQSGDILGIKKWNNPNTLLWGESYLVITDATENEMKTVKNVHPNDKDDSTIILRASNPNFKGDTIIKKEAILVMAIIKGKIRKDQI